MTAYFEASHHANMIISHASDEYTDDLGGTQMDYAVAGDPRQLANQYASSRPDPSGRLRGFAISVRVTDRSLAGRAFNAAMRAR